MSDDEPSSAQKLNLNAIDYITEHFVALSAIVTVCAAVIAMTTILSYVSVFDWSLIWIIEYSDLLKLFIIGAAVTSGYVYIVFL